MLFFLLLTPLLLLAQKDSVYHLDEYELSVSRTGGSLRESFKSVRVIEKEEIKQMPVRTIDELLSYVAGVDVRQRSPFGLQADISVRGGSFEQTLILLNGVKINDPQSGHHNFNLPLNLDAVERIEILRGAGARIYGHNAFAGAINIITKPEDQSQAQLGIIMGSYNYLNTHANISLPLKSYKQNLYLSRQSSSGYINNTDFVNHQLFYQAKTSSDIEIYAGFQDKAFGANSFYSSLFPWQWEHTRTLFFNTSAKKGEKVTFEPSVYYRYHQDEFLLKRDTPTFYRNEHQTHIYGFDIRTSFVTSLGKSSLGYENRIEQINSSVLGEHHHLLFSLFAEHKVFLRKFTVTAGTFAGYSPQFGFQLFPGIDAGYEITNKSSLYAGAGKTFRNPSFTDLYYDSPANIGNPDLKAEEAYTYELGYRRISGMYSLNISMFYRQGSELIDWIRTSELSPWRAANIGNINTSGGEAEIMLNLKSLFTTQSVFSELRFAHAFLHAEQKPIDFLSKYIHEYPLHQLSTILRLHSGKRLDHIISYRYLDRLGYKPYNLIDIRSSYSSVFYKLFIEVSNLLNTDYYQFGTIKMPGRWFSFGINIDLRKIAKHSSS